MKTLFVSLIAMLLSFTSFGAEGTRFCTNNRVVPFENISNADLGISSKEVIKLLVADGAEVIICNGRSETVVIATYPNGENYAVICNL